MPTFEAGRLPSPLASLLCYGLFLFFLCSALPVIFLFLFLTSFSLPSSPFIFFTLESQFLFFLLGLTLQSSLEFFFTWRPGKTRVTLTLLRACASKFGHEGACAQYLWCLSYWKRSQMASAVVKGNAQGALGLPSTRQKGALQSMWMQSQQASCLQICVAELEDMIFPVFRLWVE